MNRFAGAVALVTGGGTGIGRATALRLAAEGARVVVAGRRPVPLGETVAAIRETGGEAAAAPADLATEAGAEAAVASAAAAFGAPSVLVNNAGAIQRNRAAVATSPDEWGRILDANLTSAYLVSRAMLRALAGRPGAIVNVASTLALVAMPGAAAYHAAKAGVLGLTRSLAVDAAPAVRVNAVCPGLVHTDLSYVDRPHFDAQVPDLAKAHPLGRIGRPEDVAAAIAFLASADAAWITGTTLTVDGGFTLV